MLRSELVVVLIMQLFLLLVIFQQEHTGWRLRGSLVLEGRE